MPHSIHDALKSRGRKTLIEPLEDLKRHVKVKGGKVEFAPPPDLDEAMKSTLQQSVQKLNDLVEKGLVKVNADGSVEPLQ